MGFLTQQDALNDIVLVLTSEKEFYTIVRPYILGLEKKHFKGVYNKDKAVKGLTNKVKHYLKNCRVSSYYGTPLSKNDLNYVTNGLIEHYTMDFDIESYIYDLSVYTKAQLNKLIKDNNKLFFSRKTLNAFGSTSKDNKLSSDNRFLHCTVRDIEYSSGKVRSEHIAVYKIDPETFELIPNGRLNNGL